MTEPINNGAIAQIILIVLVWGLIGLLLGTQQPVPDALFDGGLIIIGFFFGNRTQARIR